MPPGLFTSVTSRNPHPSLAVTDSANVTSVAHAAERSFSAWTAGQKNTEGSLPRPGPRPRKPAGGRHWHEGQSTSSGCLGFATSDYTMASVGKSGNTAVSSWKRAPRYLIRRVKPGASEKRCFGHLLGQIKRPNPVNTPTGHPARCRRMLLSPERTYAIFFAVLVGPTPRRRRMAAKPERRRWRQEVCHVRHLSRRHAIRRFAM